MSTKQTTAFLRRAGSLVLALIMLVSLMPLGALRVHAADGTTLYLKPNSNWLSQDARFAIYYFGNGEGWTGMTDSDGDGVYEGTVPIGFPSVIFCRMNPATTENNWTNKWNQTSDLTVPTDGTNCYTIAEGAWDSGSWSTHSSTTEPSEPSETSAPTEAPKPETMKVRLHIQNTQNWEVLNAHLWNTVDSNSPGWPGVALDKANQLNAGWFDLDITITKGTQAGAVLNNLVENDKGELVGVQTGDIAIPEADEAWITIGADNAAAVSKTAPEGWLTKAPDTSVILHVQNAQNWDKVYAHLWNTVGSNTSWPGTEMTANPLNDGWFDMTIKVAANTTAGLVLNNNSGAQTNDIAIPNQEEVFIVIGADRAFTILDAAPEGWLTEAPNTTVNLHVQNAQNWDKVYAHLWNTVGSNTSWPGTEMTANPLNDGWFDMTIQVAPDTTAGAVLNNNAGTQTNDVAIPNQEEVFIVIGADRAFTILDAAPEGWLTEAPQPKQDYYLVGYINGANYGCEEDHENLGDYKFVDGKLTVTFTQESYVMVKTGDNATWYMTNDWQGDVTSATLYNSADLGEKANKLKAPAGKELTFTLVENADGTLTLSYSAKEEPKPASDYYLVGYINAADVNDNQEAWKFVDGKLTATFTGDTYVAVQDNNGVRYMTDDWQGSVTSVTLYDSTTLTKPDKLQVPVGAEVTFTLAVNEDGTLTLSYTAEAGEITPIAPEKIIAAGNGADLGGGKWLNGKGWAPGDDSNALTQTSEGVWEITYTDVPKGKGYAVKFAANGGWDNLANWGGAYAGSGVETPGIPGGDNFVFDILYDSADVTLKLDLTKCDATSKAGALVTITIAGHGDLTYTANIHFQKPASWGETVNAWLWTDNGPIPGYEEYKDEWPGKAIDADAANTGWYNVTVETKSDAGFWFILNDGANQTDNLQTGLLQPVTDLWVVDGQVLTEAPAGWVDPNRTVHVPGTFPGPNWVAASNQMTYDPELGLYVYTFRDVPAANYEFKIAINGSWNENYGLGGTPNGDNISVTVPETMDVTVYYNDRSHNVVTSITYVFADISLSGTGIPEGTKLSDPDLTGIYSVKLPMTAGKYEDLTLSYDGNSYAFAAFELKEDKEVTFYFDPATKLYYHDGSDVKVGAEAIYYNSKDIAYKAPFGAVEQNTDVTFCLDTGDDVTQATLIVKGVGSFPMAQPELAAYELGVKKWTCTVSFPNIGEYDYYFAVSNGSDVKVYGDDDGYYGEGQVCDLNTVLPYDLIVFQSGFQTPDWMKNAVIYQIFPDRFYDGDPSNNLAQTTARGDVDYEYISHWYTIPENPEQEALLDEATYKSTGAWYGDGEWSNEIYGGDLEGIAQKIPYLKSLGVNVIYLNPVFSSISSHRYDACDYMAIDPILGTLGDFEQLVSQAHANGMKVVLDGVFNHVSDDSVYFDRYYKFLGTSNKVGAYPYWAYVYDYMDEKDVDQATAETAAHSYFSTEYGITDFGYTEWFAVSSSFMTDGAGNTVTDSIGLRAGKGVYTYEGWWGYDSMPVIKSTNGSEYQTGDWAQEIIGNGSGTAVGQYWIRKGNDGWRLDVANEVSSETWRHFRSSVKALNSGDVVIIGEIWDDATKYLLGDMYDSVMNYLFRNAVTGFAMGTDAASTTRDLEKIRERYPEEAFYAMMNLVGSHDTTRILSYLDGIGDDRNQKDLYSAFPTYAATSATAKARQYLVAFLQFTYPGAPTIYYGDEIGMVGADDPDDRRAMEWGKGSKALVEWYAKLAAVRSAYPALRTGDIVPMDTEDANLLAFTREDLIVVANNAASDKAFTLSDSTRAAGIAYVDVISGTEYPADAESYNVPARSGIVLVPADSVVEVTVNYDGLKPAYDASYIVGDRNVTHQHSYVDTVVDPTCTEQGYTHHECECGESYDDTFVPATGHTPKDEGTVTPPTCDKAGYTTHICGECGDTYRTDPTEATGHGDLIVKNAVKPTCTKTGYTGDKVCEDCGQVIEAGKTIAKIPHTFDKDGVCIYCNATNPGTGDLFNLPLILGIMGIALAAIVVLIVVYIKKNKKK